MKTYSVRGKLWKFLRPRRALKHWSKDQVGECHLTSRVVRVLHRDLLGGSNDDWASWWNRMPIPKRELYLILHEFGHAFFPEHDEGAIQEFSLEMTDVLWREGFKKRD